MIASWSFGGGTALMLQIGHRESHDIDIFLDDPQVLPLLNPEVQGFRLKLLPSSYDSDGARSLKLSFSGIGEIDFICCSHLTSQPVSFENISGRRVMLEVPAEIISKKIYYRCGMLQPRDMFDIAAVLHCCGGEILKAALAPIAGRCAIALEAASRMNPQFAQAGMSALQNIRPQYKHLPMIAQHQVIAFLSEIG
ncbi:hypothetical protein APZ00_08660 [Pannonibacter phragmitetus]|uniref:Nucleotidyl transferase AbiEii toxin, Type IV TA system n=1 Tax=Pannonibacter phragmitetus TaxID=121719 RepID=A0A0U3PAN2_9HYPH|nr:hypothetical protein APZ00_08660 [Pannonibacter phragmitetus]